MAASTGASDGGAGQGIDTVTALVAVACVGLIVAVAIPGQHEAAAVNRRSEVLALAESLRSAARLGHAFWLAQADPAAQRRKGGPTELVIAGGRGGRVAFIHGYPVAADVSRLMEAAETAAFTRSGDSFRHRDVTPGRRCDVTYTVPESAGSEPVLQIDTSGC